MADNLFIQVIARLNKALSKAKIQADIKDIEKTPFYVRFTGRLNKSLTRKNIERDAQNAARNVNIDVNARISERELQRSLDEARQNLETSVQNNPIEIPVDVNTDGIQQGQQQVERQARGFRGILGDYLGAQAIFSKITEAIKKAVDEIEALNKAQTDLQIVTQKSASEMKVLMQDYNQLAKDMSSTTLYIVESADQWLRQGKSISETNELIQDSVILSKIGQIESAEATEYLTSAMNGFHVASENVIGIIDKLSAVDLNAAVSSGGLAEAMSKCSNSANIAGVSMDSLIGYIGTVAEVTQKSDSVIGESFKTIMARMGKIKLNDWIDEDGTDISGEINDVEKTLGKFGISLRESATAFRNFEDVIYDVGKAWNQFSSVDKNAIANAFGGVYQRENVLTLFENFDRALELTEVSANSAGTAMEKFSIYEQSLESATNRLTASLEGLAYNTIDSEFLTGLTNATAGIVEFIDKTQLLKTGLTAGIFTGVISGLVALGTKMVAVKNNVTQFTQAMNLSRSSTAIAGTQYNLLLNSVNGLTEAQLRLVLSSRQLTESQRLEIMQEAGIEPARQRQLLQTWSLTNATNAQTTATFSLRGAWEGLKASLISHPIGLIVTALTLATTAITALQRKQEKLRQSISEAAEKAKEQTDNLNDLIKSYEKFADKVSYTTEEKEQLKSIQDKLSESYHTEVDDIDLVNGKYDEEIEKLRQLKKEKLADAELSLIAEREQAAREGRYDNLKNKSFNISAEQFNSEDDYNNIIKTLEDRVEGFTKDISLIEKGLGFDAEINLYSGNAEYRIAEIKEAMNVLKEYGYANIGLYSELNELLSEYQGFVDTENEAISNLAENMFQQYELDNPYNEVGRDSYLAWKDGLLSSAGDDKDLRSALSNLAAQQFPDYEKYFENRETANKIFVNRLKDTKPISDFLNELSDEDLAIAIQIPKLFQNGLDGASKLIEEWKSDPNNKIDADVDTSSLEELKETYDGLSDSVTNYSKNQKTLTSVLEDQEKHGQLSASTIQELVDAGYAQALVTDKETSKVTLNVNAYKRLNKAKKESIILEAEQQKSELEEKFKDEEKAISDLVAEMQYANAERRTAIALEMQQHGLTMSDIAEEMSKIDGMVASLSAPEFDTGLGDSSKPTQVINYEKWVAQQEHEIAMGRLKEDEAYYSEKLKCAEEAYKGLADYEQDLWKVREEAYEWRKKNEQDLFDEKLENLDKLADKSLEANDFEGARNSVNTEITETENRIVALKTSGRQDVDDEIKELEESLKGLHDSLDKINDSEIDFDVDKMNEHIDGLEKTAEKISETSMLPDGTKLSTQEKFREIAAVYTEARYAIEDEINRIVQAGVEGHEDVLKELEEQSETYTKEIENNFKDAVEAEKDFWEKAKDKSNAYYDEQIDKVKEQQEASEKAADAEIDAVQAKIDALKKVNDEKQQEYDIEKAKQDLEKASQRTRMVYGSDGRIEYRADDEAIKEAQKSLDDLLLEKQVNSLENQKSVLEQMRDKESESYDTLIADIESQKEQDERQFDSLLQYLDNYLNPTGDTSNADVWSAIAKIEGATFESGKWYDKDGKVIDIDGLYSVLEKDKEEKTTPDVGNSRVANEPSKVSSGAELIEKLLTKMGAKPDIIKGIVDNLNNNRVDPRLYNIMFNSTQQPTQDALRQFEGQYHIDPNSYEVANKNTTVSPVFNGDIVVNNPVGNSDDLARELMMNLANAIERKTYSNLKKF